MSNLRGGFLLIGVCALAMVATGTAVGSDVDLSLPENGGPPRPETKAFTWNPTDAQVGLLDDFNRADGPLGPDWILQSGAFAIISQTARGNSIGLATHARGSGNSVAMDIAVDGSGTTQYAAAVLNYGGGVSNLFIKFQSQGSTDFTHGACYVGNNNTSSQFGLGFFPVSQTFASAHFEVSVDAARTVTITLTNINGGALPDQQYVCTGAPPPEGPAIGMGGLNGLARIDNFAAPDLMYPPVGAIAYPVPPIDTPCGLVHNGFGALVGTDIVTDSIFAVTPTSPTATIFFGPVDISAHSSHPIGVTHDNVTFYVTDANGPDVDFYDPTGVYLDHFPLSAYTTFPEGIAWAPFNGHLYVVDGTGGNVVHEFTTAGSHVASYAIPGFSPDGLAWDFDRDCFWLYDSGTDSIRQFTRNFTQLSRSPGPDAAGYGTGEGVAVIGDVLYVVAFSVDTLVEFDISDATTAGGLIFSDSFGTGGLSAWAVAVP